MTIYDKSGPSVGFAVSKQQAIDEFEAEMLWICQNMPDLTAATLEASKLIVTSVQPQRLLGGYIYITICIYIYIIHYNSISLDE